MAGYSVKNWVDEANHAGPPAAPPGTPLSAVAMEDAEDRLSTYTTMLAGTAAGIFNVMDYGAAGDGASDDASDIQSTINAASVAGGGCVYFPEGDYRITSGLTVGTADITLVGQGHGASKLSTVTNSMTMLTLGASNLGVKGIHFDANSGSAQGGIYMNATAKTDIRITDCKFTDLTGDMIRIRNVTRAWIQRNHLSTCTVSGIRTEVTGENNIVWIEDNYIEECNTSRTSGHASIQLTGSATNNYFWIQRNQCYNGATTGIVHIGADGLTNGWIRDNHLYGNGATGENIATSGKNVDISGNVCRNAGGAGILVYSLADTEQIHIHHNQCIDNTEAGIAIAWGALVDLIDIFVDHNYCATNDDYGIRVYDNSPSGTAYLPGGYNQVLIAYNSGRGNVGGDLTYQAATGGAAVAPEIYRNRLAAPTGRGTA